MRTRSFVLTSALAVVASVLGPGVADAAGTVTVTPSTGLVDLQTVTVTATGFGSGWVGMCQAPADRQAEGIDQCGGLVVGIQGDSEPTSYTVRRYIRPAATGETVDCAAVQCVISVAYAGDIEGTIVDSPISFAAPPPPPAAKGTLSVEPSTDLVGDESLMVTGAGFRPGVDVEVLQCRAAPADPTDCNGGPVVVLTDASGAFSTELNVSRVVGQAAGPIDCAGEQACVVAAAEIADVAQTLVTTPLSFRPPPAVAVEVAPADGLVEGVAIQVRGTGFPVRAGLTVCQVLIAGPESCDDRSMTDDLGQFEKSLTVRRHLYVPLLGRGVDCADPATPCGVAASTEAVSHPIVPIAFAPSPPPPSARGTITVAPADAIAFTFVRVTGTGFRPGAEVHIAQCATPTTDPSQCERGGALAADDAGTFFTTTQATGALFVGGDRRIDCGVAGACAMAAYEVVDPAGTLVATPVVVRPHPTVAVEPASGLRSGEVVQVTSEGWPPGSTMYLRQCGTAGGSLADLRCTPTEPVPAPPDGTIRTSLVVQRKLQDVDCSVFTCAVMGSAEPTGFQFTLINFADPDPVDAQLVRLINGSLIGDGLRNSSGQGQRQARTVAQGKHWSFALRVENEGDEIQDVVVTGGSGAKGVDVDYFYSWFDVTAAVTNPGGLRLRQLQPGEARTVVARFRVAPDAEPGLYHSSLVRFTSGLDYEILDAVRPAVTVASK